MLSVQPSSMYALPHQWNCPKTFDSVSQLAARTYPPQRQNFNILMAVHTRILGRHCSRVRLIRVGMLAFAVLNFLAYAVWWNKSLDVQCPHPLYWKSTESRPEDHIDQYVCMRLNNRTAADDVCLSVDEEGEFAPLGILAPVFSPISELIGSLDIPTSRKLRVRAID
ncbi:hypothetical protein DFJ58DRAFT_173074 [Suillus subalutaceus]|uniref:uncharacterized protein n=1 Tax=Suillus subalutaceus TaxID=48586 RepID=UPI001B86FC6C|nr:uncharacterized protein DFJ58DRAFT_173074 [Suillus subalutaceus]KAG1836370.1 hypothetical protein DFJ58DRAFT_173074 [Suillus subalutaceus]